MGSRLTLCHGNTNIERSLQVENAKCKDAYFCDLMEVHKIRHLGVATEARHSLKGNDKLYCAYHTLNTVTFDLK